MTFATSIGPRQAKTIRTYGSARLRSWLSGRSIHAPDALAAWAHLSDVVEASSNDRNVRGSVAVNKLSEAALRRALREKNA